MKKIRNLFTLAFACCTLCAGAQEKDAPEEISKEQAAAIIQLQRDLDGKIQAAFAGNEKLKAELEQDMKGIAAIKDEQMQNAAVANFQKKYGEAYSGILKKAGVDMSQVARRMGELLPEYKFRPVGNTVMGTFRKSSPAAPAPAPGPKTTRINNWNTRKKKTCGLGAGGDITFGNSSLKVFSLAAVAGGCMADADMSAPVQVPNAASAKLTVRYKSKVDGFAWGIVCSAGVTTRADCYAGSERVFAISSFVFAPFLWVASGEEEVNETNTLNLTVNSTPTIRFSNRVFTLAALVVGECHGTANTNNIDVKLITQ